MAKSNSVLNLQGTIKGLTFVNSRAYEPHVRKARSTAEVNSVFKENSRQMTDANKPARLVKNAIDVYRQDFKGGQLWQRLVSHFKKEVKAEMPFQVAALKGMEVNENFPLSRLFVWTTVGIESTEEMLHLDIDYSSHPNFKRKYIDGYRFSAIAIFPDFQDDSAESVLEESEIIEFDTACKRLRFSFSVNRNVRQYLVCLKLEGCEGGVVCLGNVVKGMQIVAAGVIQRY